MFREKRIKHSRKPAHYYSLIEQMSPGPYLELFARVPHEGWDSWGNEIPYDALEEAA